MRHRPAPTDYFGNLIEVGDRYFYGSPTVTGMVHAVKITSIEITLDKDKGYSRVSVMKCKSPDKGVCLDKIPNQNESIAVYVVTWRVWLGIEPCGAAEYKSFMESFDDHEEARRYFKVKEAHCDNAKLVRTTRELLEQADD